MDKRIFQRPGWDTRIIEAFEIKNSANRHLSFLLLMHLLMVILGCQQQKLGALVKSVPLQLWDGRGDTRVETKTVFPQQISELIADMFLSIDWFILVKLSLQ